MSEDLWTWSAADLAAAIRNKDISSRETVQAHLSRIEGVNAAVNAVTLVLAEQALSAADAADRQVAAGAAVGPLHGVPISIKDTLDLAVTATTFGIVAMKDAIAETDAPVVAHLKRAGAIPLARTNVPDFGVRWHTDNDLHGATLNPWNHALTPGGSSGGEGAAIATGMSPLGVGGDLGGSLRYPAQCCGIAALKPGFGRVSKTLTSMFDEPPMFYEQVAGVNGPMARHVRDLRLALEVMSATDPGDPCWAPAPDFDDVERGSVRIAVTADPGGFGCCETVAAAVTTAADVLKDAGYVVEWIDPPCLEQSTEVVEQIANTETHSYLDGMLAMMSDDGAAYLKRLVADTVPDLASYVKAIAERHRIGREWSLFMAQFALVLGPVSTLQPFTVGYDVAGPEQLRRFIQSMTLTEMCNLLGLPSVAVPVQVTDGIPQGVQLIGRRFHETMCLDAADMIEQALGVFTPIDPVAPNIAD